MNFIDYFFQNFKTRRDFLKIPVIIAVAAAIGSQLWIAIRFLLSPAFRAAQQKWKVGEPGKFDPGITFVMEAKIFIIRDGQRFKALSAVCTHLGCTLKMIHVSHDGASGRNSTMEFHCPCHGSKFNASGVKIAGPARKSLQYVQLTLAQDDKQLLVDHSMPVDSDYFLEIPIG